ncbi:MAG: glutamate--tRNA ligase [Candidatus Niyogibacteria bacterium]|nr:glutamate--tRNA ligase [Candidatus Niyogibacteria bacterium]
MPNKIIKTRIAPSPTGFLHIGTARTALFSWAFARQNKGKFILRVEDTDLERSDPRFEKDIIDGLKWLEIDWDGKIYRQSERLDIYKKYLTRLLKDGKAFWCRHSEEELAEERATQMKKNEISRHFCEFRENFPQNQNQTKSNFGIIRFKNNAKEDIKFNDLIRGEIVFSPEILGDFSLAKNLSAPLYNFAVVVDDFEMEISHIIRGEDHISNTPKQILIQRALGFPLPQYAHLPLILNKDRAKLSKRDGAISINEYQKEGYLPETMFNFIALLGWHPKDDREIFSREYLLKEFSFSRVQKGGAVFNLEKLNWMNKIYFKSLAIGKAADRALNFLPEEWQKICVKNKKFWRAIVKLEKERIVKFSELAEKIDYFFKEPVYSKEILRWKEKQNYEDIVRHLTYILKLFEKMPILAFSKEKAEKIIMPYAEKEGKGEVLWPFRVALCGKKYSPGPFEIAAVLGKKEVLKRLKNAVEKIQN